MAKAKSSPVEFAKRTFSKRRKSCPLKNVEVDYKNIPLLLRFVSERGRILPSRITSVSQKKQRDLKKAIKQARFIGLLPFKAS